MRKIQKEGIAVERTPTDREMGLTPEEVLERTARGQVNGREGRTTKSVPQILRDNTITPFNLLNLALAVLVLFTGSWKNCLFMGVILCNIVIGTVQELRAKRVIDKLSLIAAPMAHVIRGGLAVDIPLAELALDDIMVLSAGNQVCADGEVVWGSCEVNESLVTGESDPVTKRVGDELLSGSFIVSGRCRAQAVRVGADSYAGKLTRAAKRTKRNRSELMDGINTVIKVIGFALVPVGTALFIKAFTSGEAWRQSVVSTVAALIGMIPEGLVLLVSVVLAVSVIRLSRRNALVQELFSIERLARVDTLCLDKTGTITKGTMCVDGVVPLGSWSVPAAEEAAAALMAALGDENPTAAAVRQRCGLPPDWTAGEGVPFSSARKWSGAAFDGHGTWVLGAGRWVLGEEYEPLRPRAEEAAGAGQRVLVLAHSDAPFGPDQVLPEALEPVALFLLSDELRGGAAETLAYFAEQGVELKVISGDDPVTVASVARKAGLPGADRWVDAATLKTEADLAAAAGAYTVFGRVTPDQKLALVKALKERGHTVAMTGDGVNDVPALRESDCSVAMAAGSDAARSVSQIVLMDSDFSSMPHIVAEGRRSINNLQRSAALFLTKTVFSTIIALCFIFLPHRYPFQPIQFTLISALTIGAPSFLLALEPNRERIQGRFLTNVLKRALPGGVTMAVNILLLAAAAGWLGLTPEQFSTAAVLITGFTGLLNLWWTARPLNLWRGGIVAAMAAGFAGGCLLFGGFFSLTALTAPMAAVLGGLAVWAAVCLALLRLAAARLLNKWV